jgi:outer membrane lipoprotein carrier protein
VRAIAKCLRQSQLIQMTNFLATLALCFSSVTIANSEFSDFFNSFEALSADFTQQTFSGSNTLLTKTSGYLHFKRPASFVWQTKTPIEQTLLLNNHELWLIDTELEQASQQVTNDLKNTPLYWLMNRPENLQDLPRFSHSRLGVNWYKTNQSNQLSFGFRNKTLDTIQLTSQLDQKIQIVFSKIIFNPKLNESVFALNLAPDFDVIR